ncbi:hypothetical protein PHMEG_00018619 [Phytophthora megakarya]|uniref:CCHC-type domain-containing protein n=1 Tax=Phytophthora megakarya TaxID=4795 RepID=A0A225VTL9_9STRA|nr:hypothetical protein PHMEG_00018619 [Phytophthora megakarya]
MLQYVIEKMLKTFKTRTSDATVHSPEGREEVVAGALYVHGGGLRGDRWRRILFVRIDGFENGAHGYSRQHAYELLSARRKARSLCPSVGDRGEKKNLARELIGAVSERRNKEIHRCHKCGEVGHLTATCPEKEEKGGRTLRLH